MWGVVTCSSHFWIEVSLFPCLADYHGYVIMSCSNVSNAVILSIYNSQVTRLWGKTLTIMIPLWYGVSLLRYTCMLHTLSMIYLGCCFWGLWNISRTKDSQEQQHLMNFVTERYEDYMKLKKRGHHQQQHVHNVDWHLNYICILSHWWTFFLIFLKKITHKIKDNTLWQRSKILLSDLHLSLLQLTCTL